MEMASGTGTSNVVASQTGGGSASNASHVAINVPHNVGDASTSSWIDESAEYYSAASQTESGDDDIGGDGNTPRSNEITEYRSGSSQIGSDDYGSNPTDGASQRGEDSNLVVRHVNAIDFLENVRQALNRLDKTITFEVTLTGMDIRLINNNRAQGRRDAAGAAQAAAPGSNAEYHPPTPPGSNASELPPQVAAAGNQLQSPMQQAPPAADVACCPWLPWRPQGRRGAAAPGSDATPDPQHQPPPGNDASVLTLQGSVSGNQQRPVQHAVLQGGQPDNADQQARDQRLTPPSGRAEPGGGAGAAATSAERDAAPPDSSWWCCCGTRRNRGAHENNQTPVHQQEAAGADAAGQGQGAPGNNDQAPGAEQREPQGRLKITVAADKDDDDKDYLDKMRGWLMTVAALFVGMAFQAMLHPPEWLKMVWHNVLSQDKHRNDGNPASSPAPAHSPGQATIVSESQKWMGVVYLTFNAATFSMALTLLLVLLGGSSDRSTLKLVQRITSSVSVCMACTFAVGSSESWKIRAVVGGFMVIYAVLTLENLYGALKSTLARLFC